MAAGMGWTGAEWVALNKWPCVNPVGRRPPRIRRRGAYGIAQNINGLAGYGPNGNSPGVQIAWMLNYIRSRYGDPIAAWNHELSAGWYDQGGWLPQGLSLALNTTGAPERVGGAGGTTIIVNVAGSVATVNELAADIRLALIRQGRSSPNIGLA